MNEPIVRLFNPDMAVRTASLSVQDGKGVHCNGEVVVANGIPDSAGKSIDRTAVPGEPVGVQPGWLYGPSRRRRDGPGAGCVEHSC